VQVARDQSILKNGRYSTEEMPGFGRVWSKEYERNLEENKCLRD